MLSSGSFAARPPAALLGLALVVSLVLSACVYGTNRPYTQGAGVNDLDGRVKVLNAMIVAEADGSGTLIATLSNTDYEEPAVFESVTPGTGATFETAAFEPITIPLGGMVNLADGGAPELTGDFALGDFVLIVLGFDDGQASTLQVPVVTPEGAHLEVAP